MKEWCASLLAALLPLLATLARRRLRRAVSGWAPRRSWRADVAPFVARLVGEPSKPVSLGVSRQPAVALDWWAVVDEFIACGQTSDTHPPTPKYTDHA